MCHCSNRATGHGAGIASGSDERGGDLRPDPGLPVVVIARDSVLNPAAGAPIVAPVSFSAHRVCTNPSARCLWPSPSLPALVSSSYPIRPSPIPPDWAKANGHRAQHTGDGKRHGRDGPRRLSRDAAGAVRRGRLCPAAERRPGGGSAGSGAWHRRWRGVSATSAALGGVLGAVLGSQFGGGASAADEDCTYRSSRVRPIGSGSRGEHRLRNPLPTDTRPQLLPQRPGLPELVTQGVHRGKIREVRRTACRDRDGSWCIVD